MSAVGVFLGGEGRNELGNRADHPSYQNSDSPGVIETLLRRVRPKGWEIVGATKWCRITKLSSRGPTPKEERNVLGLVLEAKRAGSQALAFVRDADDSIDRPKIIKDAIDMAREIFPEVEVIGGTAVPVLEAWILAMRGKNGTEKLSKAAAQKSLEKMGVARKDTRDMVKVAAKFAIDKIPLDAESLRAWLAKVEEVLPRLC
jgi:hypothetical protein